MKESTNMKLQEAFGNIDESQREALKIILEEAIG